MGSGGEDTTHVCCSAAGSSVTLDATILDCKLAFVLRHLTLTCQDEYLDRSVTTMLIKC